MKLVSENDSESNENAHISMGNINITSESTTQKIPVSTENNKNNSKNNSNPKKNLYKRAFGVLGVCFSVALVAIATYKTIDWYVENHEIEDMQNEFVEVDEVDGGELVNPPEDQSNDYWDFVKIPLINVNFDELLSKNSDTVGWINIPSTNINYPIVQSVDNEYYLTHAFDKSRNSAGWVFADYRNNMVDFDKNTIIYGHSRVDGTMFGTLKESLSKQWYNNKNNHVIRISTPTKNTSWQVFSVYKTSIDFNYLITTFQNNNSFEQYLNDVSARSAHNFSVKPDVNGKIITVSTCANNLSNDRIVVHARLIKEQIR